MLIRQKARRDPIVPLKVGLALACIFSLITGAMALSTNTDITDEMIESGVRSAHAEKERLQAITALGILAAMFAFVFPPIGVVVCGIFAVALGSGIAAGTTHIMTSHTKESALESPIPQADTGIPGDSSYAQISDGMPLVSGAQVSLPSVSSGPELDGGGPLVPSAAATAQADISGVEATSLQHRPS